MLPESIIVTTTLSELEDAADNDKILTGCCTIVPMSNVIRLTPQTRHYSIKTKPDIHHTKRLTLPHSE
ncbi:DUF222 domain-containing protein [Mycobacterium lepromatosis]|uniref:DUF222 domain-containing protein n=1 Tax=Mycobacterium lepromatosis TaxID=480418 RepID=UPI000B1CEAF4|nr:hypothetical protein [Mycobacterium lepromatosis]